MVGASKNFGRWSGGGASRGMTEEELPMSNQGGNFSMGRRAFLIASGGTLAGLAVWRIAGPGPGVVEAMPARAPGMVSIVEFSDAGVRGSVASLPKIVKTESEWRKLLSPDAFEITRRGAFTALLNVHEKGVFRCICCDTALFNSDTKFESGTGWPSFWAPIAKENVVESTDLGFGMVRTAVGCRRCEAHTGHVFNDGPRPTGLRYCMNSVAMKFSKAS